MTLEEIDKTLAQFGASTLPQNIRLIAISLLNLRRTAILENQQNTAKNVWMLQQVLRTQQLYLGVWNKIRLGDFHKAWCDLERIEITLYHLERHYDEVEGRFSLNFIADKTKKLQTLFPYKTFSSTEFVVKRRICSVCSSPITFRRTCGHIKGEIYDGKMCSNRVVELDWIGTSIVKNPAHKFAVVFPVDLEGEKKDSYDYGTLKGLLAFGITPFEEWGYIQRSRPEGKKRNGLGRNDRCHCGIDKKYKNCCLTKDENWQTYLELIRPIK